MMSSYADFLITSKKSVVIEFIVKLDENVGS